MSGAMRQTRENLVLSQPMCLCCLRSCVSLLLESVSNIFFHIFAFLHSSCSYFLFFWITMIERVCVVVFFAKILKSIHILALWKQREENWNVCRALSYGFGRMSLISTRFTIDKWRTNRNKKAWQKCGNIYTRTKICRRLAGWENTRRRTDQNSTKFIVVCVSAVRFTTHNHSKMTMLSVSYQLTSPWISQQYL